MGLMLSVLVSCVGVIELVAVYYDVCRDVALGRRPMRPLADISQDLVEGLRVERRNIFRKLQYAQVHELDDGDTHERLLDDYHHRICGARRCCSFGRGKGGDEESDGRSAESHVKVSGVVVDGISGYSTDTLLVGPKRIADRSEEDDVACVSNAHVTADASDIKETIDSGFNNKPDIAHREDLKILDASQGVGCFSETNTEPKSGFVKTHDETAAVCNVTSEEDNFRREKQRVIETLEGHKQHALGTDLEIAPQKLSDNFKTDAETTSTSCTLQNVDSLKDIVVKSISQDHSLQAKREQQGCKNSNAPSNFVPPQISSKEDLSKIMQDDDFDLIYSEIVAARTVSENTRSIIVTQERNYEQKNVIQHVDSSETHATKTSTLENDLKIQQIDGAERIFIETMTGCENSDEKTADNKQEVANGTPNDVVQCLEEKEIIEISEIVEVELKVLADENKVNSVTDESVTQSVIEAEGDKGDSLPEIVPENFPSVDEQILMIDNTNAMKDIDAESSIGILIDNESILNSLDKKLETTKCCPEEGATDTIEFQGKQQQVQVVCFKDNGIVAGKEILDFAKCPQEEDEVAKDIVVIEDKVIEQEVCLKDTESLDIGKETLELTKCPQEIDEEGNNIVAIEDQKIEPQVCLRLNETLDTDKEIVELISNKEEQISPDSTPSEISKVDQDTSVLFPKENGRPSPTEKNSLHSQQEDVSLPEKNVTPDIAKEPAIPVHEEPSPESPKEISIASGASVPKFISQQFSLDKSRSPSPILDVNLNALGVHTLRKSRSESDSDTNECNLIDIHTITRSASNSLLEKGSKPDSNESTFDDADIDGSKVSFQIGTESEPTIETPNENRTDTTAQIVREEEHCEEQNVIYEDDFLRSLDGVKRRPLSRTDERRRTYRKKRSVSSPSIKFSRGEEVKAFSCIEKDEEILLRRIRSSEVITEHDGGESPFVFDRKEVDKCTNQGSSKVEEELCGTVLFGKSDKEINASSVKDRCEEVIVEAEEGLKVSIEDQIVGSDKGVNASSVKDRSEEVVVENKEDLKVSIEDQIVGSDKEVNAPSVKDRSEEVTVEDKVDFKTTIPKDKYPSSEDACVFGSATKETGNSTSEIVVEAVKPTVLSSFQEGLSSSNTENVLDKDTTLLEEKAFEEHIAKSSKEELNSTTKTVEDEETNKSSCIIKDKTKGDVIGSELENQSTSESDKVNLTEVPRENVINLHSNVIKSATSEDGPGSVPEDKTEENSTTQSVDQASSETRKQENKGREAFWVNYLICIV